MYEKKLIVQYIGELLYLCKMSFETLTANAWWYHRDAEQNGTDPLSGEALTVEDLIDVKASTSGTYPTLTQLPTDNRFGSCRTPDTASPSTNSDLHSLPSHFSSI